MGPCGREIGDYFNRLAFAGKYELQKTSVLRCPVRPLFNRAELTHARTGFVTGVTADPVDAPSAMR